MRDWAMSIFAVAFALGAPAVANADPTMGAAVPQGSYTQTCSNISFDTTSRFVSATCDQGLQGGGGLGAGPQFQAGFVTNLQVTHCDPGADIANIRGWLQCKALSGTWGQGGAVPNGSYQQSCRHWVVINRSSGPNSTLDSTLSASCWTYANGRIDYNTGNGWVDAQIRLAQCDMNGDIQNYRGTLLCQPAPQNTQVAAPPPPPQPTPGTCKPGYVWRGANPTDLVCVTPQERQQTADDNAAAAQRLAPTRVKKGSGPRLCVSGYVWRNAYAQDYVCVTPRSRQDAANENTNAPAHTW